jgi:GNAT superfamily N-acetyltransferase
MNDIAKLMLKPAVWSDYSRFVNLCCVPTMPKVTGPCWIMSLLTDDETAYIEPEVAFIGYSYPFRNNARRHVALPYYHSLNRRRQIYWLNKNVRCLTRVMVKPEHRGRGIAKELIRQTVPKLCVPYVECLTFTAGIAKILTDCGFTDYGQSDKATCNYYLKSQI